MSNSNKEYINCNLCGHNYYKYLNYEGGNRVVKCSLCGLIYRNPRSVSELDRESESIRLYGNYIQMERDISFARKTIFRKILNRLEKKINKTDRIILDIGCGQAYFLKIAKEFGWQVQGVEPVKSACEYAKRELGINIINKSIEEVNFKESSFDVITLWNVLDHLLDPLSTLKEIRRILKSDGILVIRVPNVNFHLFAHKIFSFSPILSKNKKLRDPSVIVNYGFSSKTIKRILEKAGFWNMHVYNAPLSYGDPYKIFKEKNQAMINLAKHIYYGFSLMLFCLSFKAVLIGPSLLVYAKKTNSNNMDKQQ